MKTSATAKKSTISASGTAGKGRVMSDEDIEKLSAKVSSIKGKASAATDTSVASADVAELAAAIGDLTAGIKAANQKAATAEGQAAALEAKNTELSQSLATVQAEMASLREQAASTSEALTTAQASLATLTQELDAERTAAKAGLLALEINQLREQASALVQARQMTPADFNDIFGKDDAEAATKISEIASSESSLAFVKAYVERLASFSVKAAANPTRVSVVEPTLPKIANGEPANSIGAQAAALVNTQFKRG